MCVCGGGGGKRGRVPLLGECEGGGEWGNNAQRESMLGEEEGGGGGGGLSSKG